MDNPRPEKVAVVNEVRARLGEAEAAILTEYRGLTVAEMAILRKALAAVGGDYKVYKNTLVKLAVAGGDHEQLEPLLVGPTAIAFVSGEVTAVAKALRDFARTTPALVVKGGVLGGDALSAADLASLAELPSRDVLLSRIAGGLAAPMQQMASLLQALPRNLAYGLKALIEQGEIEQGEIEQGEIEQGEIEQGEIEQGETGSLAKAPEHPGTADGDAGQVDGLTGDASAVETAEAGSTGAEPAADGAAEATGDSQGSIESTSDGLSGEGGAAGAGDDNPAASA